MTEYVPRYDVWVTQRHMPMRVRGFCRTIGASDCVIVNEDMTDELKRDTVLHEVRHIRRGDLQSEDPVSELEKD